MSIINALPYTLTNGTTADATQVMANFNQIVNNVNANAQAGGSIGLWTPTDASGASLSFTGVAGHYTAIGNLVYASANVTYPATASGAAASIGGLPFGTASYCTNVPGGIVYTNAGLSGTIAAVLGSSSSQVNLATAGSGVAIINSALATYNVLFSIVYPVT